MVLKKIGMVLAFMCGGCAPSDEDIAHNRSTPAATLIHLAADPDPEVRRGVARNNSTPGATLRRLAGDRNPEVRARRGRPPRHPGGDFDPPRRGCRLVGAVGGGPECINPGGGLDTPRRGSRPGGTADGGLKPRYPSALWRVTSQGLHSRGRAKPRFAGRASAGPKRPAGVKARGSSAACECAPGRQGIDEFGTAWGAGGGDTSQLPVQEATGDAAPQTVTSFRNRRLRTVETDSQSPSTPRSFSHVLLHKGRFRPLDKRGRHE